jgi:hypothetical protein
VKKPARMRVAALCAGLMCATALCPAAAYGADASLVSELRGVRPPAEGLELQVAGGDRFLQLTNGTGEQVIVKGYDDEPYLRFLANRVVEVNERAPSKYANEDRYALRPVPSIADSDAQPRWRAVSDDGSYRWFDHRIHLMERGTPPQVKDEDKRTKIFDWSVPLTVGGGEAQALGTLEWVPDSSSGASPLLVAGLGALGLLVGGGLVLVRRRRGGRRAPATGQRPAEEAW